MRSHDPAAFRKAWEEWEERFPKAQEELEERFRKAQEEWEERGRRANLAPAHMAREYEALDNATPKTWSGIRKRIEFLCDVSLGMRENFDLDGLTWAAEEVGRLTRDLDLAKGRQAIDTGPLRDRVLELGHKNDLATARYMVEEEPESWGFDIEGDIKKRVAEGVDDHEAAREVTFRAVDALRKRIGRARKEDSKKR